MKAFTHGQSNFSILKSPLMNVHHDSWNILILCIHGLRLEAESRTKFPHIFDAQVAFQHLLGTVTYLLLIKSNMSGILLESFGAGRRHLRPRRQRLRPWLPVCTSEIVHDTYALPCQHRLLPVQLPTGDCTQIPLNKHLKPDFSPMLAFSFAFPLTRTSFFGGVITYLSSI